MAHTRNKPPHFWLGGRANKKLTVVVLFAFVGMVIYMKVGYLAWSGSVARRVPLWGKCIVLLSLLASIWYSDWVIQRRVSFPSLAAPRLSLFIWDGLVAFAFAVITADSRLMFYSATFAWIIFLYLSNLYYRRALMRRGGNDVKPH